VYVVELIIVYQQLGIFLCGGGPIHDLYFSWIDPWSLMELWKENLTTIHMLVGWNWFCEMY